MGCGDGEAASRQAAETGQRCRLEDLGKDANPQYLAAAEVLLTRCGQTRCHGPQPWGDLFDLAENRCDIGSVLVDVPSCEYPSLPRVAPGDPEGSWLMVKLTAPSDEAAQLIFEPATDAEPAADARCVEVGFGTHMPPPGFSITEQEVEVVREWIAAGAPGPEG